MYKITGGDLKDYGPIPAEQIRAWIREGRVNRETRAQSADGGEWKTLADFPEFADALASGTAGGPPPLVTRAPASTTPAKTSGLAIASLVLGILGLVSCGLTAIVGLILGIVALVKINQGAGQLGGKGLAIAGISVSGVFIVLLPIYASLMLPALSKAKDRAITIKCVSNLKQIGLAGKLWAGDHNGTMPADFQSMTNELVTPKVLVCPKAGVTVTPSGFTGFDFRKVTYQIVAPGAKEDGPIQDYVFCPLHGHAVRTDGSVIQGSRK